jgi:Gpi18-like mannosyltransferase
VLLWIVIVNVFAFVALNRFNLNPDTSYKWITPDQFPSMQSFDFVNMHNRWDSYWYLDIIQNGYYLKQDNTLSNVVFFPLYPTLMKIVGTIFLGNFILAGWLISSVSLVLACAFLYRIVCEFHPDVDPELPVLLMLVFPTAFFLNVVYTEALFLFLTTGCFYYTLKRKFWYAGFFALFGALTHSNGVFLALPILWETVRLYEWKALFTWRLLPVALAPLGMAAFLVFDYVKFHDLMLFFKIESAWGRSFSINYDHFSLFSHPSIINMGIDIVFTILIITAVVLVYHRLSRMYAVFMSLTVFAALSSGTLMSIGRYSLVLFPLFILLATIKNKTVLQAWIFGSALFLAMDITLFVSNYWAG